MGYFQTPWHILLLLLIALLLFGGKRLPEMGRALGSGMREFKEAVTGHSDPEQTKLARPEQGQPSPVEPTTAASPGPSEHKTD
jgi:sec-independent protein translocase protein TatA